MKRDYPAWVFVCAALALGMPPVHAHSTTWVVGMCSGGTRIMVLPTDPAGPAKDNRNGCCDKACHVGSDRRKRGDGMNPPCC